MKAQGIDTNLAHQFVKLLSQTKRAPLPRLTLLTQWADFRTFNVVIELFRTSLGAFNSTSHKNEGVCASYSTESVYSLSLWVKHALNTKGLILMAIVVAAIADIGKTYKHMIKRQPAKHWAKGLRGLDVAQSMLQNNLYDNCSNEAR